MTKAGGSIQTFSESTHIEALIKACKMMKIKKKSYLYNSNLQSYLTYNPTYDLKAEHDFVILFHIYFAILHIIIIFSKATKLGHIYNISITL